jgi:hypothetical protein
MVNTPTITDRTSYFIWIGRAFGMLFDKSTLSKIERDISRDCCIFIKVMVQIEAVRKDLTGGEAFLRFLIREFNKSSTDSILVEVNNE